MKRQFIFMVCLFSFYGSIAQIITISIPYENYYTLNNFPKSNEKITFSIPNPFVEFKDSIPDKKTSYQFLFKVANLQDSLLSIFIQYAMNSFDFEQIFCNYKKGAEIWHGYSKCNSSGHIPVLSGIYYKNFNDSTSVYILTGYSLTHYDKKSKINYSKLIGDRIKTIIDNYFKRN